MATRELGSIDKQQVLHNVPQYLKENYRFVLVNKRKQPINEYGVGIEDWMNWGNQFTFGMAWALWNDDTRGVIAGIAIVLPVDGDITCIDVDDISEVQPQYLDLARRTRIALWQTYTSSTYIEQSGSGLGGHIFVRASHFDHIGRTVLSRVNIQVYARNRIIVLTGNRNSTTSDIATDEGALRGIYAQLAIAAGLDPDQPVEYELADDEYEHCGRVNDLTDEQVLAKAQANNRKFADFALQPAGQGEWSDVNAHVIGDLDKITSLSDQIYRIAIALPYVTQSGPDKAGNSRAAKFHRIFHDTLRKMRPDNDRRWRATQAGIEHGKAVAAVIMSKDDPNSWAARSQQGVKDVSALSLTNDGDTTDDYRRALERINAVAPGNYMTMTTPPGVVGEFVNALAPMVTDPRYTYMLPAVLSSLAGYIAQTYKLDGIGPTLHFIIAGMSNTGKTTTFEIFDEGVQLALNGYHRNATSPRALLREDTESFIQSQTGHRMVMTRASSVQGIYDKVQSLGAGTWLADEAEAQIRMMLDEKNAMGLPMKAFYKQLFGSSGTGKRSQLDASRANTKHGVVHINNLSFSTALIATSEVLQNVNEKELQDGTLSRAIIMYDEVPMRPDVKKIRDCARGLPLRLARIIRRLALVADDTAKAYDQEGLIELINDKSAEKGAYRKKLNECQIAGDSLTLPVAMDADAAQLIDGAELVFRTIAGIAQDPTQHEFKSHYHSFSRTELIIPSIACILAVADMIGVWCDTEPDPHAAHEGKWRNSMPQARITRAHMQWAIEFVTLWRLRLLKAWDEGKVAVTLAVDEAVVIRQFQNIVRSRTNVSEDGKWVRVFYLHDRCRRVKPFSEADNMSNVGRTDAAAMVVRTIDRMIKAQKICKVNYTEVEGATGGEWYGLLEV